MLFQGGEPTSNVRSGPHSAPRWRENRSKIAFVYFGVFTYPALGTEGTVATDEHHEMARLTESDRVGAVSLR